MGLLKINILKEDVYDVKNAIRTVQNLLLKLDKKDIFKEYPELKADILNTNVDLIQNTLLKYRENIVDLKEEENMMNKVLEFISYLKIIDEASE